MCEVRHAQITQNNTFAISLRYPKKEVCDEVDFFHTDKHENLLYIDSMILKSRTNRWNELIFCMLIKIIWWVCLKMGETF